MLFVYIEDPLYQKKNPKIILQDMKYRYERFSTLKCFRKLAEEGALN